VGSEEVKHGKAIKKPGKDTKPEEGQLGEDQDQ
jgi:hypothetical protein